MRGRRRERRLQRAGADGRPGVARRGADAHALALPAPDPRALFAGLHVGDAAQASGARGQDRRAVPRPLRSAPERVARTRSARRRSSPRSRARCRRSRASTRTASSATSSTPCRRRSAPTTTSSTNDGQPKPLIAIKFESRKVDGLPLPQPLYEIFVYSPRVEGVHLRFGKVARGGIRWSDRPQDFRTEVLGLVKAQQVKNAVIVPVGAKGGFVPKHLPAGGPREAIQAEGTATYKLFISTLLDITDNLDGNGVVPPDNVVRHDGDDPYLVVAADKGTATFSDIANAISERARLLARRRLRLRRLGRLRPQEDGHHRARRLGGGEAPFPRDGRRHHDDAVHRRRRRRHVGRRVRQRHAARDDDPAGRGLRPPRHLHRSRSRSGEKLRRAQAAVRAAALELAGLRQGADLQGRRRVLARVEGDRAVAGGAGGARPRARTKADAAGGDERDPEGAGRSAVLRRHRHLCARLDRERRGGRRPRQRCDPRHRRAAPRQGDRRGRQSRHDPARPHRGGAARACGSTPTPSTIRPASTPPTSRSTSRSRSARRCATGGSPSRRATRCSPR